MYTKLAILAAFAGALPAVAVAQEPFDGEDLEDDYWNPPVITPTGQATKVSDAPSTTYIVTGDELRRSGADTIPEVLRRVPGLDVRWIAGADGQIGPRGFAYELAERLLVLVDGRSAYIDFHGGTAYELLPVSPLDIERIEIVVGPGASVYGNKAMLGTIHIITKSPGEYPGFDVWAAAGTSLDAMAATRYAGGKGAWRTRASAGAKRRTSFNPDATDDALRVAFASIELAYEPSPAKSLSIEAGVSHGELSIIPTGSRVDSFGATLGHAKARGTLGLGGVGSPAGELGVLLIWNHGFNSSDGFPAAEGGFEAAYATPVAEVTHNLRYTIADQPMQLRWGGEVRANWLESTITSNEEVIVNVAGFASHEAMLGKFRLTTGARVDRQTFTDVTISPRVSLVFAPVSGHQFRVAYNTGYNNPTQVQLFSDFEAAPGARVLGQTDHAPERIVYGEAGYRGVLFEPLQVFVNGFTYRIDDTIALNSSEVLQTGVSFFENNSPVHGMGGEAGFEANLPAGIEGYAHYAYLRLLAADDYPYEADNLGSPLHKVSVGARYAHDSGVFASTDLQWVGPTEIDRVPATPGSNSPFELTELEAYTMAHARVGLVPAAGMEASLSVMNLLGDRTVHFPGGEAPQTRAMVNWSYHY